ncbi:MAG: UvrD-helicase domain-containing protein [Clostridiales bacterium]|nr:UvrD-helicase domain-containing protein [Clostridiales bacterium]
MEKYIKNLNEQQLKAVLAKDGPILVLAGAGSGKTRVLTSRIAYLVKEKKVHPASVLAITFTNKAAKEMRIRVEDLLDNTMYFGWIGTFHSMCVKMLRQFCEQALPYNKQFMIYDSDDKKIVIKDCLKELDIDSKMYSPKMIAHHISSAKNELLTPKMYEKKHVADYQMSIISKIYTLYQHKLEENNAMDFDDLIFNTVLMLENNENIRNYFQQSFRYILIDEYQDTNEAQYRFAEILARKHNNIFVVGDDDQSIYGWRGANIKNILNFEHDFKGCQVVKLEQNYRSTSNILDAANAVIKHNVGRKGKNLWTDQGKGEKIHYQKAYNGVNEALIVATEIKKLCDKDFECNQIAVLYRTNAQSRSIELALSKSSIPYRVYGSLSFYSRKEVKDVLAYLKLILNEHDDLQFKRTINEPKRGIGKTTMTRVEQIAIVEGKSMYEIASLADKYSTLKTAANKLRQFIKMIEGLKATEKSGTLEELYDQVMTQTNILGNYNLVNTIESRSRIENIKELKSAIVNYVDEFYEENGQVAKLEDFLAACTLATDQDNKQQQKEVTIMTLHAAKGLEFSVVFITGLEEGLFPSMMSFESESKIEEERRLCYVGITRAKEKLYLLNASERTIYGKTQHYQDSRFLNEVPSNFINRNKKQKRSKKSVFSQTNKTTQISITRGGKAIDIAGYKAIQGEIIDVCVGDRILHKKYGEGTIEKVSGENNDKVYEIVFDMGDKKRFMAAFTKLKKI